MTNSFDVIIVDDEESARNILGNLISRFYPELNVVATCEDLTQAVSKIEEHQPNLVFLDIEMPNYAGYEIVTFFKEINFEIIFITAYDHYAVKAFEVAAVDYLLKPIEIDRLKEAIERFKNKVVKNNAALNFQVLQESLTSNNIKNIIVQYNGGQKSLPINDIISIEANESYSEIKTIQNEVYLMSKNLKYYELLLENNTEFFRSHKSWIINKIWLEKFSFTTMDIHLKLGIVAKLSKYKKQDFLDVIK